MSYVTTQFNKITKRKPKPSLKETLSDKAYELRAGAESHASVADHMLKAASEEKQQARVKTTHAAAVEQAYAILDKAGVQL